MKLRERSPPPAAQLTRGELSAPHLRREIGGLGRAGGPKVPEASGVFPCRVGGGFHHVALPFFFFRSIFFFFQVDFI